MHSPPFTVLAALVILPTLPTTACTGSSSSSETGRIDTDEPSDAEIRAAAARDCAAFLARIPNGSEAAYGFRSRDELQRTIIGRPFRVIVAQIGPGSDGAESLRPLDKWRVPVIVDGSARALLTVVRQNGELRATDFGAAALSGALEQLENKLGISNDAPRFLVRAFALRRDFLYVETTAEAARFYPTEFPRPATNHPTRLTAPPAALTRSQVFERIRAHRKAAKNE